ncbi:hypothetical protein ElyMa_002499800 [Elysia marginata]|uniref:Reverse transcriptase domain-containing protein n=1 Tax=Elysia marginata TaxID=1093978 RepID=A0AAV4GS38_9GAST|nr:hypothetical protein ElyMa_002499800 [Elysia marginata]
MSPNPPPTPPKLLKMIMLFHDGMIGTILYDGSFLDHFPIKSGVKQACVLASMLFGIFSPYSGAMPSTGQTIAFLLHSRSDGILFNLPLLRAKAKVDRVLTREMLFADGAALATHSVEALQ